MSLFSTCAAAGTHRQGREKRGRTLVSAVNAPGARRRGKKRLVLTCPELVAFLLLGGKHCPQRLRLGPEDAFAPLEARALHHGVGVRGAEGLQGPGAVP